MSRIQPGTIERSTPNPLSLWESVRVREYWQGRTWVTIRNREETGHFFPRQVRLPYEPRYFNASTMVLTLCSIMPV